MKSAGKTSSILCLLAAAAWPLLLTGCDVSSAGGAPVRSAPAQRDVKMSAAPQSSTPASRPGAASPASPAAAADARAALSPAGAPVRGSQRIRDITFDTIKFNIQKEERFRRSMLTRKIEALDGQRVRLRGYMLPSFKQFGLTQFVLVRDNMQCCFGPGAALYDCIVVEMDPHTSTDYSVRPIAVEGVFNIRELIGPDDKCMAIYHLQGNNVK